MRYLSAITTFVLVLLVVLFATSNKEDTRVDFYPLPDAVFAGPLYLLVFVTVFAGFLTGAFVMWNAGRATRRTARTVNKKLMVVENDLEAMRIRAEGAEERLAQSVATRPDPALSTITVAETA